MKRFPNTLSAFFVIMIFFITPASAQNTGETTFKQTCAACHSIGKGRLVGPDLVNVHQRKSPDWIVQFVKSSQSVIKGGDKYADSLYQAYNRTIMPDQPTLSDTQIKDVISYIEAKSSSPVDTNPAANTGQTDSTTGKGSGKMFTTMNIFLMGIILFMLIVIFSLSRINKNLLEQIKDYYSSDSAFFK